MNGLGAAIINPRVRMHPAFRTQGMVYRFGEHPRGFEGYTPVWIPVTFVLAARETQDSKVNLYRDFALIALTGNSPQAAGFRMQLYDVQKKRRITERGINFSLGLGSGFNPFFLVEPYQFKGLNRQILIRAQNLATVANTVQVVLYGVALRWNE